MVIRPVKRVTIIETFSLLQIFLIDMLCFPIKSDNSKLWSTFIESVINHPLGLRMILGYDFKNDLKTLANTSPVFSKLKDLLK